MHFVVLPASMPVSPEATSLIASGRLARLDAPSAIASLGPEDFVLLHVDEIGPWLTPLSERCRAGQLGSIRILLEGRAPRWESIGFRVRPWVQCLVLVGVAGAVPEGTTPAPILRCGSLGAALEGWDQPAFRASEVPTAFPPKLQVETTALCMEACPYCPRSTRPSDRTQMAEDLFRGLMAECAVGRPDSIELYLNGDPLADRRLERLADLAKEACPASLVEIITHERSLSDRRARRLAASGLDVVYVSVNFHLPTTPGDMRARLERVASLRQRFVARHKQLVVVTLANLLTESGRADMEAITAELGLPVERFRATSRLGSVDLTCFPAANGQRTPADRVCERPFTKAYVRATGAVLLCCEDWDDRWVLGNVNERSLAEIWASTAYRERRRSLLAGRPLPPCDQCEYAGPAAGSEATGSDPLRAAGAPATGAA